MFSGCELGPSALVIQSDISGYPFRWIWSARWNPQDETTWLLSFLFQREHHWCMCAIVQSHFVCQQYERTATRTQTVGHHQLITRVKSHSHLQSFATPPLRVAVRRREVIRHADGRGWEKMENVEFRNFPSMTSRKSYCISKIIIFETVSRWLTCDYSPRNNTMSHLLPAVIWWPSSRCICRCLLIGGKLNSIKFLWRYLKSWIKANDT